jgi:hypothetical protein
MSSNVGPIDRVVRFVVAALAVVAAVAVGVGTVGGIILLVVGGVMLVTGLVGFCPLYRVFGVNTCKLPKAKA